MPSQRRVVAAILSIVVALPVASVAVAPGVAAATCSVTNARTGATVTSLKTAIKTAKAGDTLKVKGTCTGAFTIGKNLKVTGSGTAPTLKGAASGPVVTVAASAKVTLTGLTITGGKGASCAEWDGYVCAGGILNNGTLTLDKMTIRSNGLTATVDDPGAFGAGIYATYAASTTIKRSTIRDNSVSAGEGWAQGAAIANEGVMSIVSSTIAFNVAASDATAQGGGIFNAGATTTTGHDVVGSLTITNATITGNGAFTPSPGGAEGGGIFNESGAESLLLKNVTVTDNSADEGGGVYSPAPLHLFAALIADNAANTSPDCSAGATLTASNSLLGANDGCGITVGGDTGNQAGIVGDLLDAKLGPLAKNGGRTKTHALLTGSPAIDAAGVAPCYLSKDQRGVTRPKGSACDVGAFEKG